MATEGRAPGHASYGRVLIALIPTVLRWRSRGVRLCWLAAHLVLLLAGFELYHAVGLMLVSRSAPAHAHANTLIRLEQWLHIFIEPQAQHIALHHPALPVLGGILSGAAIRQACMLIYSGGQMPWLASMLLWLYLFRRTHFALLSSLIIVSTFLALLISAVYPVAPPRFVLAGAPYKVEDITGLPISEQALARVAGFHPYAAFPSMHMLWALLTGLGLFLGTRYVVARLLATLFPLAIMLSVVLTGNHYVLDCLASAILLGICVIAYRAWRHARFPYYSVCVAQDCSPQLHAGIGPLVLCGCTGMILLISGDHLQQLIGVLLLCCTLGLRGRRRTGNSVALPMWDIALDVEWGCGFLLVAGSTAIGSTDPGLRLAASLLWLVCGIVLLSVRVLFQPTYAQVFRQPKSLLHGTSVSEMA